jgi:arylsulfatase A-like enzyme
MKGDKKLSKKKFTCKKKRIVFGIILFLIVAFICLGFFGKYFGLTGFVISPFGGNVVETCKDCNVILISIDNLRADHLPCYGYDKNTAPAICKFAKEEVLFENAYSSAPWTFSSHFSMMTGVYPKKMSELLITSNAILDDSYDTLAEKLKREGYQTQAFTGGGYVSGKLGFSQGFDSYDERGGFIRNNKSIISFIKNNTDKKFFLFLHDFQVHAPYDPPKQIKLKFFEGEVPQRCVNETFKDVNQFQMLKNPMLGVNSNLKTNPTTKKNNSSCASEARGLEYAISQYDADIYAVDITLGEILESVKQAGLLDKTIIIITADHGEGFGEHDLFFHGNSLYNELIHVPFIIHIPHVNSDRINTNVEIVGIIPSIMEVLGLKKPEGLDGLSFVPVIEGAKYSKMILSFMDKKASEINQNSVKGILTMPLNNKTKGFKEVYDLSKDPREKNNIINQSEETNSFDSIGLLYNSIQEGQGQVLADPEVLDQLKALGYLN